MCPEPLSNLSWDTEQREAAAWRRGGGQPDLIYISIQVHHLMSFMRKYLGSNDLKKFIYKDDTEYIKKIPNTTNESNKVNNSAINHHEHGNLNETKTR